MHDGVTKTRTISLQMRPDGILHGIALPGVEQTIEDARENLRITQKLVGGKLAPLLMDIRESGPLSREARQLYAGDEAAKAVCAQAFVATSPFARVAGNMFIRVAKTRFPTRLFNSEERAIAWLKGFLK